MGDNVSTQSNQAEQSATQSVTPMEPSTAATPVASQATKKRRKDGSFPSGGIIVIVATFNNTKVSATSNDGRVLAWTSGGRLQSGTRKSSPSVAEDMARSFAANLVGKGLREVKVILKGMGPGRDGAIRGLASGGLRVMSLRDMTGSPHNGCRRRKKRRM